MKKYFVRAALTASLLCSVAGVAVISTPALAQMGAYGSGDQDKKQTAQPAAKQPGMAITNPAINKALQDSQKAIQANDFVTASADLKIAQAVPDPTPIETYYMNKFAASIAVSLKDYPAATAAYEANAASPVLPDADKPDVFHNVMVLETMSKNWTKVIEYGKQLEALNKLDDQSYGVLALGYYNTKDMTDAKAYAQKSIDAAKTAGKAPNQTVLEIVMGAEVNSKDTEGAVKTLEQLVLQYNKPDDWRQLTNFGLGAKGIKLVDALYIYRLKDVTGCLSEADDFTTPGEIANQLGYPTEALKFFEAGLNSGKTKAGDIGGQLGKARTGAAQDSRSLGQLAASAAKSKTGEQDVKMAEDYWGYGRYADAEASARSAIAKGGLKDPSEGQMILGMSLVAQNKYDEAVQVLGQATGNEGRTRAAHLWSLYAQAKKNQAGGSAAAAAQPPAK